MNEVHTDWWRRASAILSNPDFRRHLRQVHGSASLAEYAPDPVQAKKAIPFTYQADRLYATALQVFLAASIEIARGASLHDSSVLSGFRTAGNLFYYLYLSEHDRFADEDLLLRCALAFDLAGFSANSVVALKIRSQLLPVTAIPPQLSVSLAISLFLSRRTVELREVAITWQAALSQPGRPNGRLTYMVESVLSLTNFFLHGVLEELEAAIKAAAAFSQAELEDGTVEDWYLARGFELALLRLRQTSVWLALGRAVGELTPLWQAYVGGLASGTRDQVYSSLLHRFTRGESVIDLWPSQLSALDLGFMSSEKTDLVVRMPTSAGKTRLAEFRILARLNTNPNLVCVYVVPFVALANQARTSLRASLGRVGLRVTDLFQGELELTELDQVLFDRNDVIICTPEKLDLMVRRNPAFLQRIGLLIFDEGHMIDISARGVNYEFLIERLRRTRSRLGLNYRMLIMSAVVPNAADLATWITGTEDGLLDAMWKPTEVRVGVFHWNKTNETRGDISYKKEPGTADTYYVPGVLYRAKKKTQYHPSGKSPVCAQLAKVLMAAGPVVIYASTKKNVLGVVKAIGNSVAPGSTLPIGQGQEHQERMARALTICRDYLGDDHLLVRALQEGYAFHTGDLPQVVRAQVEKLYETGTIGLLVCTNTLAQGVNLPVKSLLVHSLQRGENVADRISARDFMNMAGRAARALRQLEGQVVFVHDDKRATFLLIENQVQNLASLEGYVLSSVLLLYAHLAQQRGELIVDDRARGIFRAIAQSSGYDEDSDDRVAEALTALDSQLLGLLVEEDLNSGQIDASDTMAGSLFDIQSRKYGLSARPVYEDLTARLESIAGDLTSSEVRRRFFMTGLRQQSCIDILAVSSPFLNALAEAPATLDEAEELIRLAFMVAITAAETRPRPEAAAIPDLFSFFWDWIRGAPVRQMVRPEGVTAELLSRTIEDLFVRKVPWGLNSLFALLEEEIRKVRDPLPEYLRYLPAMSRYGVPIASATLCRAVGISDRASAILMGRAANDALGITIGPDLMLDWLAGLSQDDCQSILEENEGAVAAYEELQDAQLGNPGAQGIGPRRWERVEVRGIKYHTSIGVIEGMLPGKLLALVRDPANVYDANAVQVIARLEQIMLGYLDRDFARIIAPLIDEGREFVATVVQQLPPELGYPFGRLFIRIAEVR